MGIQITVDVYFMFTTMHKCELFFRCLLLTFAPECIVLVLFSWGHCIQPAALWNQWQELVCWLPVHVSLPYRAPLTQHYMSAGQQIPGSKTIRTHTHNPTQKAFNLGLHGFHIQAIHSRGGSSIEAEEVGPPLFLRGKRKIYIYIFS